MGFIYLKASENNSSSRHGDIAGDWCQAQREIRQQYQNGNRRYKEMNKGNYMKILMSQKTKEYLRSNEYKKICMTRGKDRRISIFPKQKLGSLFSQERERAKMLKLFMPLVEADLENDGYNMIEVSDELKNWAGVEDEFIIIGKPNRIEIWSKSNYNLHFKDNSEIIIEEGSINCD